MLVTWSSDFGYPQVQRRCAMYLKRGHQTVFAGCDRNRRHGRTELVNGVRCEYLLRGRGYHNVIARLALGLWIFRLFWFALRVDATLIHVLDFDSGLPVALACRLRGLPFVYDVLDNYEIRYPWPAPIKALISRIDRMIATWASTIVLPDENRIVGGVASQRHKIIIIYVCPPDYGIPRYPDINQPFTVYAMGFLGKRRGLGLLLEAAAALPEVRFILAGQFLESDLRERADALENVQNAGGYIPWQQATELAWQSDVIFAFFDPSYEINRRAASQKWFEAMMTGRPILGNSEIMKAEWIEKEKIGFGCRYDSDSLQLKIRELAENRQECRSRGARGRQLFEEEYNWPRMEERLYTTISHAVPALRNSRIPETEATKTA